MYYDTTKSLSCTFLYCRVEAFSLLHGHLAVVFFSLHLVHEVDPLKTSSSSVVKFLCAGNEIEWSFAWESFGFSTAAGDSRDVSVILKSCPLL